MADILIYKEIILNKLKQYKTKESFIFMNLILKKSDTVLITMFSKFLEKHNNSVIYSYKYFYLFFTEFILEEMFCKHIKQIKKNINVINSYKKLNKEELIFRLIIDCWCVIVQVPVYIFTDECFEKYATNRMIKLKSLILTGLYNFYIENNNNLIYKLIEDNRLLNVKICGKNLELSDLYRNLEKEYKRNLKNQKIIERLKTSIEDTDEQYESNNNFICCVVCLSDKAQMMSKICKHLSSCISCSVLLDKCPICRKFSDFEKIFY